MTVHSEWQMLCIAEGIEQGDTIDVESEDGSTESMMFLGSKGKLLVLLDSSAVKRWYSPNSLEEKDGYTVITGKSATQLTKRQLLGYES